jgi:hypothetical protein
LVSGAGGKDRVSAGKDTPKTLQAAEEPFDFVALFL